MVFGEANRRSTPDQVLRTGAQNLHRAFCGERLSNKPRYSFDCTRFFLFEFA